MATCCPICYKIRVNSPSILVENCEPVEREEVVQQRFFKFFQRYLNEGNGAEDSKINKRRKPLHEYYQLEKLSEIGLLACRDCLNQMESFCDLYDKLKETELLLNWKVLTMKNRMTGAQRVSSRVKSFREFIDQVEIETRVGGDCWGSGNEIINFIANSRKALIGKCSRKVENVKPILSIVRWEPDVKQVESTNVNDAISVIRTTPQLEDAETTNVLKETVDVESPATISRSPTPAKDAPVEDDNEADHEDSSFIHVDHGGPHLSEDDDDHQRLQNTLNKPATKGSAEVCELSPYFDHFPNTLKIEEDSELVEGSLTKPETISEVYLDNVPSSNIESDEGIHRPLLLVEPVLRPTPGGNDNNNVMPDEPSQSEAFLPATSSYTGIGGAQETFRRELEIITETIPSDSNVPKGCDEAQNSETRSRLRSTHKCHKCGRTFSTGDRLLSHEKDEHGDDDDKFNDLESLPSEDDDAGHIDNDMKEVSPPLSSSSSTSSEGDSDDDIDFLQDTEDESPEINMDIKATTNIMNDPSSQTILEVEESLDETPLLTITPAFHKDSVSYKAMKCKTPDPKSTTGGASSEMKETYIPKTGRYFRLKCPDCNILFRDVKRLLTHRRNSKTCTGTYDPNVSIKVEVVVPPPEFKQRETLASIRIADKHFSNKFAIIDIPQRFFQCKDCGLVSYSNESLAAHKLLHGKFKCNFCKKKLTYAKTLAIHELQHSRIAENNQQVSGEKPSSSRVNCPQCDFSCSHRKYDYQYLPHYTRQHMSLKWYGEPLCAICKTTHPTLTKWDIGGHFKLYHDLAEITDPREIVRCHINDCDAYFIKRKQLVGHLNYHHQVGKDQQMRDGNLRFNCKDCAKSYLDPNGLRKHRMKHHVPLEKVIPCPFKKCKLVYETRQQLEFHLASFKERHKALDKPKAKEFVHCPVCNKGISSSKSIFLKLHVKTHETSHVCEQCGKQFNAKKNLENHKLAHSGPESWKYSCTVCGKKCLNGGKLNEHMRTHTKETPYVCEICGQKYAHRHNLRIHVNNKHGDEVQDNPKKYNTKNLTSKKGIKRKKMECKNPGDDGSNTDQ